MLTRASCSPLTAECSFGILGKDYVLIAADSTAARSSVSDVSEIGRLDASADVWPSPSF